MKNAITVISPRSNRPSSDEMVKMIKSTKGRFLVVSRWKVMGLIENGWQELVLKKELKELPQENKKKT